MIPPNEVFIENAKKMKVRKTDLIVCYDHFGMLGGPRLWYLFKLFGAKNVKLLNGGLPKWKAEKRSVEAGDKPAEISLLDEDGPDAYSYAKDTSQIVDLKYIYSIIPTLLEKKTKDLFLLDARLGERYHGLLPESRPGLRAGHIPGSINVPYKDFLNVDGCTMKSLENIKKVFEGKDVDYSKKIIATCGTGVTACSIIFALSRLGISNFLIYDGAWSEYVFFLLIS